MRALFLTAVLLSLTLAAAVGYAQPYGVDPNAQYDTCDDPVSRRSMTDPAYQATSTGGPWDRTSGTDVAWNVDNSVCRGMNGTGLLYLEDFGTPDHYVIVRWHTLSQSGAFIALRGIDQENFIGMHSTGTGSSGMRLGPMVNDSIDDDRIRFQGYVGGWIKIEAEGDQITVYDGGTAATPGAWTLAPAGTGSNPATITEHQTATIPGLRSKQSNRGIITYIELGRLGAGPPPGPSSEIIRRRRQ